MNDGRDDPEPPADGRQFDAVTRFEPEEPGPGDVGPPVPEAPDPTAGDGEVNPRVQRLFWLLVLVFKVALIAGSIGLLLLVIEGNRELGGPLFVGGLLLFAYGVYRTRWAKAEISSMDDADDADGPAETSADEADDGSVDAPGRNG